MGREPAARIIVDRVTDLTCVSEMQIIIVFLKISDWKIKKTFPLYNCGMCARLEHENRSFFDDARCIVYLRGVHVCVPRIPR